MRYLAIFSSIVLLFDISLTTSPGFAQEVDVKVAQEINELHYVASRQQVRGDVDGAIKTRMQIIDLYNKHVTGKLAIAGTIEQYKLISNCCMDNGDFDRASTYRKKLLDFHKKMFGNNSYQVAKAKLDFAAVHEFSQFDQEKQKKLSAALGRWTDLMVARSRAKNIRDLKRVLAEFEKTKTEFEQLLGKGHIYSLRIANMTLHLKHNLDPLKLGDERDFDHLLNGMTKLLGDSHPETIEYIIAKGMHLARKGDDKAAEKMFVDAFEKASKHLPHNVSQAVGALDKLSFIAFHRRDYVTSRHYLVKGLEAISKHPGSRMWRAHLLSTLAETNAAMTDYKSAETAVKESIKLYQAELRVGRIHQRPQIMDRLDFTAQVLSHILTETGRHEEAQPYLDAGLKYRERKYSKNSVAYLIAVRDIALNLRAQRKLDQAKPYYDQIGTWLENKIASAESDVEVRRMFAVYRNIFQGLLLNVATFHFDTKNHKKYFEYIELCEKYFKLTPGDTSHEQAQLYMQTGYRSRLLGKLKDAEKRFKKAISRECQYLDKSTIFMTEADLISSYDFLLTLRNNIVILSDKSDDESLQRTYTRVWQSKGLVGRSILQQNRLFNELEKQTNSNLRRDYMMVRKSLAEQSLAKIRKKLTNSAPANDSRKYRFLSQLKKHSQLTETAGLRQKPDYEKLSKLLGKNQVLIDFIENDDNIEKTDGKVIKYYSTYEAFVIRNHPKTGKLSITHINLGRSKQVESAVTSWRKEVALDGGSSRPLDVTKSRKEFDRKKFLTLGNNVYQTVWAKIEKQIGDCDTVWICPEGNIGRIPWNALPLPVSEGQIQFAIEKYKFINIPNARFLMADTSDQLPATINMAMFYNPDFGKPDAPKTATASTKNAAQKTRSINPKKITNLPGTKSEFEKVSKVVGTKNIVGFTGKSANEKNLRNALGKHAILHIASHGFFLNNPTNPNKNVEDVADPRIRTRRLHQSTINRNPFIASGVVLADIGNQNSADDGLFSGEETLGHDLRHVRLVVLSACDSGLGRSVPGDASLGIQYAYLLSGARSTLTSLWRVDDQNTAILMERFYANMIDKKMSIPDALRNAQLQLLKQRGFTPSDWGAWMISGTGR